MGIPTLSFRDRLSPTTWTALALVAVAVAATVVAIVSNALDNWAPNIATEALSIAVTIAVVERIVRREEERRGRAPRESAYGQIDLALLRLYQSIFIDYVGTHRHTDRTLSGDPHEMFVRWREDNPDTRRGISPFHVNEAAREFAEELRRIVSGSRDYLSEELRAAASNVDAAYAHTQKSPFGDESDFTARWVLSPTEEFARVYRKARGKDWRPDLFAHQVILEALPEDEATLK
jgi:hypothetical protein